MGEQAPEMAPGLSKMVAGWVVLTRAPEQLGEVRGSDMKVARGPMRECLELRSEDPELAAFESQTGGIETRNESRGQEIRRPPG